MDALLDFPVGQGLLDPGAGQSKSGIDVDRFQQLDPSLDGELGPVADRVGQRAGTLQFAQGARQLAAPDLVEEGAGGRSVICGQCKRLLGGFGIGDRIGFEPQDGGRTDDPSAEVGPAVGPDGDGGQPPAERVAIDDGGDYPGLGELAVDAGHEQKWSVAGGFDHLGSLGGLDRDGHDHVG